VDRPAESTGEPRPRSGENVLQRPVSTIASQHRIAKTRQRGALRTRVVWPWRDQSRRERYRRVARTASQDEHADGLVQLHDRAGALSRSRIEGRVARRQLVLLGRKAEEVLQRVLRPARRALRLQTADRLAVLHQLVERHLAAGEEPPPCGPSLAPVVFQQLSGQPARRPGARAREQRLA